MDPTIRSSHIWHSAISRRGFLGLSAAATGALAAGLRIPTVLADNEVATVFPRPIPGGVTAFGHPIHHFPPLPVIGFGPINEPSAITDFKGLVGITRVRGKGTGTNLETDQKTQLYYQVDNGFNTGLYIGEDGRRHHGTFAFV